jgi:hypothetical protein
VIFHGSSLIAAGLDELERRLRAGIYPLEDRDSTDDMLFTSEQYDQLRAIVDRDKDRVWQERLERGWICTATRLGGDERTTAPLCGGCPIPDRRILCAQLMHPVIDGLGKGRTKVRAVVESPLCNIGKDPDGSKCHLGGLDCARRIVGTDRAIPEPPADIARRAADEVDFFSLVYRERYGSRVWSIPQARTISEFFGDCEGADDFQHRVAALADLMAQLKPFDQLEESEQVDSAGNRVGSLVALKRLMERDHPEDVSAVKTLRRIADARIAFPIHSGPEKLPAALRDLGIAFPPPDWRLAWLRVLTAFWASLQEIRSAMQTHAAAEES